MLAASVLFLHLTKDHRQLTILRIVLIHAGIRTLAYPRHNGLHGLRHRFFDDWLFRWAKSAQHIIHGVSIGVAYPDSQSRIFRRAQMSLDVAQPIVTAVRSPGTNSKLA